MKVFIGGSISIKQLDNTVKNELSKLINGNNEILVGDAYGVDSLVQKYYYDKGFRNVTVYTCNRRPRNNIGDFQVKYITPSIGLYGREFYAQKDRAMSYDCNFALMIWDGTSIGTLENIRRLAKYGVSIDIYLSKNNQIIQIKNYNDYKKFKEQIQ